MLPIACYDKGRKLQRLTSFYTVFFHIVRTVLIIWNNTLFPTVDILMEWFHYMVIPSDWNITRLALEYYRTKYRSMHILIMGMWQELWQIFYLKFPLQTAHEE